MHTIPLAVLGKLNALTIVDLVFGCDVVATLAHLAFQSDSDSLVVACHNGGSYLRSEISVGVGGEAQLRPNVDAIVALEDVERGEADGEESGGQRGLVLLLLVEAERIEETVAAVGIAAEPVEESSLGLGTFCKEKIFFSGLVMR